MTYERAEDADRAKAALHGTFIDGRRIEVLIATYSSGFMFLLLILYERLFMPEHEQYRSEKFLKPSYLLRPV